MVHSLHEVHTVPIFVQPFGAGGALQISVYWTDTPTSAFKFRRPPCTTAPNTCHIRTPGLRSPPEPLTIVRYALEVLPTVCASVTAGTRQSLSRLEPGKIIQPRDPRPILVPLEVYCRPSRLDGLYLGHRTLSLEITTGFSFARAIKGSTIVFSIQLFGEMGGRKWHACDIRKTFGTKYY